MAVKMWLDASMQAVQLASQAILVEAVRCWSFYFNTRLARVYFGRSTGGRLTTKHSITARPTNSRILA